MKSAAQSAAEIRAALKGLGLSSRQVSVRASNFSLGSSIDVRINDPDVPLSRVSEIAKQHEHVRHCEITGEILGGGNRYVSVEYSADAMRVIARRYEDAVQRAVNAIPEGDSSALVRVDGTRFYVGRPDKYTLTLWDETSYVCQANDVHGIACVIGKRQT
jgi:hypothetical protein